LQQATRSLQQAHQKMEQLQQQLNEQSESARNAHIMAVAEKAQVLRFLDNCFSLPHAPLSHFPYLPISSPKLEEHSSSLRMALLECKSEHMEELVLKT
jgi:hypothetical protein